MSNQHAQGMLAHTKYKLGELESVVERIMELCGCCRKGVCKLCLQNVKWRRQWVQEPTNPNTRKVCISKQIEPRGKEKEKAWLEDEREDKGNSNSKNWYPLEYTEWDEACKIHGSGKPPPRGSPCECGEDFDRLLDRVLDVSSSQEDSDDYDAYDSRGGGNSSCWTSCFDMQTFCLVMSVMGIIFLALLFNPGNAVYTFFHKKVSQPDLEWGGD